MHNGVALALLLLLGTAAGPTMATTSFCDRGIPQALSAYAHNPTILSKIGNDRELVLGHIHYPGRYSQLRIGLTGTGIRATATSPATGRESRTIAVRSIPQRAWCELKLDAIKEAVERVTQGRPVEVLVNGAQVWLNLPRGR